MGLPMGSTAHHSKPPLSEKVRGKISMTWGATHGTFKGTTIMIYFRESPMDQRGNSHGMSVNQYGIPWGAMIKNYRKVKFGQSYSCLCNICRKIQNIYHGLEEGPPSARSSSDGNQLVVVTC